MADDMSRMDSLVSRLCRRLGHDGVRLSEDGTLGLRYGDRFDLWLEMDGDAEKLHLFADIGSASVADRATLFARLLVANMAETGDARFALDPATDRLFLTYALPSGGLDEIGFATVLENVLADCSRWQDRLDEMTAAPSGPPDGRPTPRSGFIRA